jgi:hypothetical protein
MARSLGSMHCSWQVSYDELREPRTNVATSPLLALLGHIDR